ncbi:MAG TPA: hypothetical protein VFN21_07755, partial [Acidimicrobiales bacterium]|nr:hypothetical protein [Acidimicrobiales bacterium]
MPEDSGTTGPPPDRKGPASPQRRKLLVTGAFVAASAVALRNLPRPSSGHPTTDRSLDDPVRRHRSLAEPPALDGAAAQPGADHVYETVIRGGRVIDPDSGFDGTLDVGIDKGTITGFGETVRTGKTTIDAKGRVVSPGFIDVLSYEPTPRGSWY